MKNIDDLSRRELLALKDIRQNGRTADHVIASQLRNDAMIAEFQDGNFQLTNKGRRMLVRGSPSLWAVAL